MALVNDHQVRRRDHVKGPLVNRLDAGECDGVVQCLLLQAGRIKPNIGLAIQVEQFRCVLLEQLLDMRQHQDARAGKAHRIFY